MYSEASVKGIRFNDCLFSETVPLLEWIPPRFAGLFVVLVHDTNWAPKPLQPLLFGELGNNTRRPLLANDFIRLSGCAGGRQLLVSVLPMPFSTTAQRCALRDELVWAYNPTCQTVGGQATSRDLAGRITELETQHREQTAQVLQLLANMNGMFEPQAVPHRRRIGFSPESSSSAGPASN